MIVLSGIFWTLASAGAQGAFLTLIAILCLWGKKIIETAHDREDAKRRQNR